MNNTLDYIVDDPQDDAIDYELDTPDNDDYGLSDDELRYKDEVVEKLLLLVEEYLTFSTTRDLLRLLGDNL